MPIQQVSCDFKHLSMPIHFGPCRSHPCSRTTEGAAVITGTGWRRGGGPATWTRWSMARASASTLDGARTRKAARTVLITPPPGHYEPGAVGLHRRSERSDRRAVSDRMAAWRTSRTKNRAGRRATGTLKTKSSRRPGVPLPSLHREAIPTRSSARKDRETDDARPQAPMLPPLSTFELPWLKPPYLTPPPALPAVAPDAEELILLRQFADEARLPYVCPETACAKARRCRARRRPVAHRPHFSYPPCLATVWEDIYARTRALAPAVAGSSISTPSSGRGPGTAGGNARRRTAA